ncbi:MAG: peptide chain release factor N(5)-glutamine methyltransferase, partial [Bacteroidota bacterium]
MVNVKHIWEETANQLEKVYERRESENISYLLLEDLFRISRADILMNEAKDLDSALLSNALERLLTHEPIHYVTGVVDFYERKFKIETGALIPRPETEELVALIIEENRNKKLKIMDIGVGSGCIAITLQLEMKATVSGIDISNKALNIASNNAQHLGADVNLFLCDILNQDLPVSGLDILVCNPPYIPQSEKQKMHLNVLNFEPEKALFVTDDDPLMFYKRIAMEGRRILKKGGRIYFEIHEQFGNEIEMLLSDLGYFDVKVYLDMQGK